MLPGRSTLANIVTDMNYVSAVYGVVVVIVLVDWFARGRRSFRGSQSCLEDAAAAETEH